MSMRNWTCSGTMMKANRLRVSDRLSGDELVQAARQATDARVSRRILAIRYLLAEHSPDEAAGLFAIGRTQLYAWAHRYNEMGLSGLSDGPRSGRLCSIGS